ncbi:MAG: hypothetical protein ACI3XU_05810 [Butyricicoccaceae bacterium]
MKQFQRDFIRMESNVTDADIRDKMPEQGKRDFERHASIKMLLLVFVILAVILTIKGL